MSRMLQVQMVQHQVSCDGSRESAPLVCRQLIPCLRPVLSSRRKCRKASRRTKLREIGELGSLNGPLHPTNFLPQGDLLFSQVRRVPVQAQNFFCGSSGFRTDINWCQGSYSGSGLRDDVSFLGPLLQGGNEHRPSMTQMPLSFAKTPAFLESRGIRHPAPKCASVGQEGPCSKAC